MARLVAALLFVARIAASEDSLLFGHDPEALLQSKQATRSHVSVEVWNRMMDSIMEQTEGKSWSDITPAVQEGIDRMIGMIDNLEAWMKKAFVMRQQEITDAEAKLQYMDGYCKTEFGKSKTCMDLFNQCVTKSEDEKDQINKCHTAKDLLWHSCDAACQGRKHWHSWQVPQGFLEWQMCDVSEWHDCERINCASSKELGAWVDDLGYQIDEAWKEYKDGESSCKTARYALENQEAHCMKYRETYKAWEDECKADYNQCRQNICTFGNFMQTKCVEVVHYDNSIQRLWDPADERAGTEWAAVSIIRCMLKSYKDDEASFNIEQKTYCEEAVDMNGIKGIHYQRPDLEFDCHQIQWDVLVDSNLKGPAAELAVSKVLHSALFDPNGGLPHGQVFAFCGEHINDHKCPYAVPYQDEKCDEEYLECKYESDSCCPGDTREPTVVAVCVNGYWEVTRTPLDCDDYDCGTTPPNPTPAPTYTEPTEMPTPPPYQYYPTPMPTEPYTTTTTTTYTTTTTTEPYEPTPPPAPYTTTTYRPE